jgi:ATP/ADP translocase
LQFSLQAASPETFGYTLIRLHDVIIKKQSHFILKKNKNKKRAKERKKASFHILTNSSLIIILSFLIQRYTTCADNKVSLNSRMKDLRLSRR